MNREIYSVVDTTPAVSSVITRTQYAYGERYEWPLYLALALLIGLTIYVFG